MALISKTKGRNPDMEGYGLDSLMAGAMVIGRAVAASLRWYYPDQVHRVSSTPDAAASQPNGSPSSDMMLLCR